MFPIVKMFLTIKNDQIHWVRFKSLPLFALSSFTWNLASINGFRVFTFSGPLVCITISSFRKR